jgi:hypothetical protein
MRTAKQLKVQVSRVGLNTTLQVNALTCGVHLPNIRNVQGTLISLAYPKPRELKLHIQRQLSPAAQQGAYDDV